MPTVYAPTSEEAFDTLLTSLDLDAVIVLNFHTPWAAPCVQMNQAFAAIADSAPESSKAVFISINAEKLSDVSERYDVTAVPLVLLYKNGEKVGSVSGADPKELKNSLDRVCGGTSSAAFPTTIPPAQSVTAPATNGASTTEAASSGTAEHPEEEEPLHDRLAKLVKAAPVMLFMKGTPAGPQCGFSRQLVALLREKGVRYGFFNILADDEVRQGLKEFSNWPTYPQLYVRGELVGGLDIVSTSFA